MFIIWVMPRITKAIPAPLAGIGLVAALVPGAVAIPAAVLALSMRKPAARPAAAGGSAANRRPGAATGDDRPSIWFCRNNNCQYYKC